MKINCSVNRTVVFFANDWPDGFLWRIPGCACGARAGCQFWPQNEAAGMVQKSILGSLKYSLHGAWRCADHDQLVSEDLSLEASNLFKRDFEPRYITCGGGGGEPEWEESRDV